MRRALAILAMAVGLVAMAQSAMAVSWGPNSSGY
jgi:hypothetical protein